MQNTRGGHNRKPNELHALTGTGRPDRGTKEQVAVIKAPVKIGMEAWVKSPDVTFEVDRVHKQVVDWMNLHNMAYEEYSHSLSLFLDTYMQYVAVQQIIRQEGIDAPIGNKGALAISLLTTLRKDLRTQMYEFGLTPSARSTLVSKAVATDDAFTTFFGD